MQGWNFTEVMAFVACDLGHDDPIKIACSRVSIALIGRNTN